MSIRVCLCVLLVLLSQAAFAQDQQFFIPAGDNNELIIAIDQANADPNSDAIITIQPGPGGETSFDFPGPINGSNGALPPISTDIQIIPSQDAGRITMRPSIESGDWFRLVRVIDGGRLVLRNLSIEDFRLITNSAGAISMEGDGMLDARNTIFRNNYAEYNGGAIDALQSSRIYLADCELSGNRVSFSGGAISLSGEASAVVSGCTFSNNSASVYGCDISSSAVPMPAGRPALNLSNNIFSGGCGNVLFENPLGVILSRNNSFGNVSDIFNSTGMVEFFGNALDGPPPVMKLEAAPQGGPKPEALCNDFGTGAFSSMGYNIAGDGSCALGQSTDLSETDPMIEWIDGVPMPEPGSAVIDSGPVDVIEFSNAGLASLPCGYKDATGTARPQDANDDGIYECDRGAIEVVGAGEVTAAHSAVFFNPDRSGEGNYVEILEGNRAVVYTFTYDPMGSGPAWFLGVGEVSGNAIVLDELFRPTGTPFGDGFNAAEVDFTSAGSMSMVFGDCEAAAPGGSIAYTGDSDLGYEALMSRATRLAHITGCGAQTPAPNAGLSGSWFDPDRNGEGVIVEWLSTGDVLAVFFTYDPDGNQFWLFGQGQPNGNSVTIQAVYPESVTAWGRNFVPADVKLGSWGTMTLTWTDCNKLTFAYDSTLPGFGAGTHQYVRLSTLAGTTCPAF